jgi:poly(3-hydroxybutyrate) depolymerase
VAAIAGLAGSMDVDSTQCSGKSGNVLHIHGDSDGTISYTGGSIFAQRYQSVDEVMKGWSNNNQCTAKPENQLDVIAAMSGPKQPRTHLIALKARWSYGRLMGEPTFLN